VVDRVGDGLALLGGAIPDLAAEGLEGSDGDEGDDTDQDDVLDQVGAAGVLDQLVHGGLAVSTGEQCNLQARSTKPKTPDEGGVGGPEGGGIWGSGNPGGGGITPHRRARQLPHFLPQSFSTVTKQLGPHFSSQQ